MTRVMMTCTRRGTAIFTGIDLPAGSRLDDLTKNKVHCPVCGRTHGVRRPFFEGEGPNEFHKYFVALDCESDFAAEVGVLVSCHAIIEDYLPRLLVKLTGVTYDDAFTIIGSFMSFASRVDLLKVLADFRHPPNDAKTAIERLVPRLKNANSIRNQYAHARYGITFHDNFTVDSYVNDAKRKSTTATKSLDAIVADVNTLKVTIGFLHGYIYRDEIPPP